MWLSIYDQTYNMDNVDKVSTSLHSGEWFVVLSQLRKGKDDTLVEILCDNREIAKKTKKLIENAVRAKRII